MSAAQGVRSLADVLVARGWARRDEVDSAAQEAERTGERLDQVLRRRGRLTDLQLVEAMAEAYGLPASPLDDDEVDAEALTDGRLPWPVAEEHRVVPLRSAPGVLRVGLSDPARLEAIEALRGRGLRVEAVLVPASRAALWLARLDRESPRDKAERILARIATAGVDAPEGPVRQLFDTLLAHAVRDRASDIHLEPDRATLRVRLRIDGVLHQAYTWPKSVHPPLVNAIKMASRIDISQRLLPQDGKLVADVLGRPVDVRVATFPGLWGEHVVLRILDKLTALRPLEELGYSGPLERALLELLRIPYGMILMTGPTGSGKTTTLYACLQRLASTETAVMTIEDPVEYELPLVKQATVNDQAGFTFDTALEAMLRCDPDIILVGEIRNRQTAALACQAALTGHVVFSTLHTNSAPEAVTRLLDLGVAPSVLAAALRGVVSQRLVRLVCPHCRRRRAPDPEERGFFAAAGLEPPDALAEGAGCEHCRQTGYRDRAAIAEVLRVTVDVQRLIAAGADAVALTEAAPGWEPLVKDGLRKVAQGQTTLREVLRVAEWRG